MNNLISLQQIRDNHPCTEGWTKLLRSLGNPKDLSVKVSIGDIAWSNGTQDALWCLRCYDFDRRDVLRSILPSVKRASVHSKDTRVHNCILSLEAWIAGDETVDLKVVAWAATEAARAATEAAAEAAGAAAWATAWAARAATEAAGATAWAATGAAARAARAATEAAGAAEKDLKWQMVIMQVQDIIAAFPLHAFHVERVFV